MTSPRPPCPPYATLGIPSTERFFLETGSKSFKAPAFSVTNNRPSGKIAIAQGSLKDAMELT